MFIHENEERWYAAQQHLQHALRILQLMKKDCNKPMMEATLLDLIETCEAQAGLWAERSKQ